MALIFRLPPPTLLPPLLILLLWIRICPSSIASSSILHTLLLLLLFITSPALSLPILLIFIVHWIQIWQKAFCYTPASSLPALLAIMMTPTSPLVEKVLTPKNPFIYISFSISFFIIKYHRTLPPHLSATHHPFSIPLITIYLSLSIQHFISHCLLMPR